MLRTPRRLARARLDRGHTAVSSIHYHLAENDDSTVASAIDQRWNPKGKRWNPVGKERNPPGCLRGTLDLRDRRFLQRTSG